MGKYFSLTLDERVETKTKQPKKMAKKRNGGFHMHKILIAGLLIAAVSYLIQVNSLATRGYEIKDLQSELTDLKEQGKRLEVEMVSLKSIENIEQQASELNFIPSARVNYLPVSDFSYRP